MMAQQPPQPMYQSPPAQQQEMYQPPPPQQPMYQQPPMPQQPMQMMGQEPPQQQVYYEQPMQPMAENSVPLRSLSRVESAPHTSALPFHSPSLTLLSHRAPCLPRAML